MLANLRLRQRVLLGFLAPFLVLLAVMLLVYSSLLEAMRQAELLDNSHTIVAESRTLAFQMERMQRASRGYLLQKDAKRQQDFQDAEKEFNRLSESLAQRVTDPQQAESLKNLVTMAQRLRQGLHEEMALVDGGKPAAALALFRDGETTRQVRETEMLVDNFNRRESELLKPRQAAQHAAVDSVVNSVVYGMITALVMAVVIAFWLAAAVSRKIVANAAQLSAAASEIAATIVEHERTAAQQAAAANETSATIEQLSVSSSRSAEQAANAAAVAEKAGSVTAQGGEAVRTAVASMGNLKDKIGAMAEQILHLGEQTGQIGSIATLVKDLSAQINMLALNAAVEAARAGEHGKGFAVVASEVRKLADESKKSAEQAGLLVADIQKAANTVVMTTEEGTRTVVEVTQLAGRIAELFGSLAGMAGSVNENAQQVMLNARQQSAAFGQVVEATNSIAAGARETAAGISQTKIGVERLNDAAANLKAIV